MAIGLACGMAFSGSAHAIKVAANGVGQVLIAPFYLTKYTRDEAGAGSRNLITVINTSSTHAVKVKAVIRSQKYCKEVLDFLIMLSPADVWRGEIYYNTTSNKVQIRSTDDSIRNLPFSDSFASVKSVDFPVFEGNLGGYPGDDTVMGHIEFIGHYTATGVVKFKDRRSVTRQINVRRGISKVDLARLFETTITNIVNENAGCPQVGAVSQTGILNTSCPVRLNDTVNFKIRGNVEVIVPSGARMTYQMTALTASDAGLVIGNPSLSIDVSTETALGEGWGFNTTTGVAFDNILDIEKAFATFAASGSYENGLTYEGDSSLTRFTAIQVTFPTKYRHQLGDVCATAKSSVNHLKGQFYPPFTQNGDVKFQSLSYDNRENLNVVTAEEVPETSVSGAQEEEIIIPEHVITNCSNMLFGSASAPLFTFESGAYKLIFNASTGGIRPCPYAGVPAIVQTYKFLVDGNGDIQDHTLIPASSDGWPQ
jgi:hypothetical protein